MRAMRVDVFDMLFQSTHPVRGATANSAYTRAYAQISIHAPREGCDGARIGAATSPLYFNPRTP